MPRHFAPPALIVAIIIVFTRCGGSPSAPTTPSTAPSSPQFTLSGRVFNALAGNTSGVAGASVQVVTGVNTGRSVTADGSGRYQLEGLTGGNMSIRISAANFETVSRDVTLSATVTIDFALSPTSATTTGRVVDADTQVGLGGVTISGGAITLQSDGSGTFAITGTPGSITSPLLLTFASPARVARQTSLRVPGKDVLVSLIASSFDLVSFDQMFRTPELDRWTAAPPIVIETRSGQFVDIDSDLITTIGDSMSDAEYASMVSDLTTGLAGLSGNAFTAFASVTRQTSAPGDIVNVVQDGVITVMRVRGMEAKIGWPRASPFSGRPAIARPTSILWSSRPMPHACAVS